MNAIILFSYVNIQSLDDIEPFYNHLFRGNVNDASLDRSKERFASLGTCDPLASNTRRIGESLVRRMTESTGEEWTYYIGNKHILPFVEDAVKASIQDGVKQIYTFSLTPFYSRTGTEYYEKQVVKALTEQARLDIAVTNIPPYYNHQGVVDVFTKRLNDAIHWFGDVLKKDAEVIFTVHSMPGTKEAHEEFITQYQSLAKRLIDQTELTQYHIAYRSAGPSPQRWLEPDILNVIQKVADQDGKAIIVCELLSVIANAEAMYELGDEAKLLAKELDLSFVQTEYLNDSDDFLTALANHLKTEIRYIK